MDYKVIWTDPAIADLQGLVAFRATNDPDQARAEGFRILDHTEVLASFPFIGPVYDSTRMPPVHEILCGPYRIFYRVHEKQRVAEIMHVRHGARAEPPVEQFP